MKDRRETDRRYYERNKERRREQAREPARLRYYAVKIEQARAEAKKQG